MAADIITTATAGFLSICSASSKSAPIGEALAGAAAAAAAATVVGPISTPQIAAATVHGRVTYDGTKTSVETVLEPLRSVLVQQAWKSELRPMGQKLMNTMRLRRFFDQERAGLWQVDEENTEVYERTVKDACHAVSWAIALDDTFIADAELGTYRDLRNSICPALVGVRFARNKALHAAMEIAHAAGGVLVGAPLGASLSQLAWKSAAAYPPRVSAADEARDAGYRVAYEQHLQGQLVAVTLEQCARFFDTVPLIGEKR